MIEEFKLKKVWMNLNVKSRFPIACLVASVAIFACSSESFIPPLRNTAAAGTSGASGTSGQETGGSSGTGGSEPQAGASGQSGVAGSEPGGSAGSGGTEVDASVPDAMETDADSGGPGGSGGTSADAGVDSGDGDIPDASDDGAVEAGPIDGGVCQGVIADGGDWPEPDPPDGAVNYYASVEGLTEGALKSGLLQLVQNHNALSYDGARAWLFGINGLVDSVNGQIECVYTGKLATPDGTNTPGGFNTEHSWPASLGASNVPAKSDLHHLFPSDALANNARGNYLFGNTNCVEQSNCKYNNANTFLGISTCKTELVFQVRPETRGDIARAHFYFSIRYSLPITLTEESILRVWHAEDPPSERERTRNENIFAIQNNRNPFVDRPEFVTKISDF
jgi:hypothetical protein